MVLNHRTKVWKFPADMDAEKEQEIINMFKKEYVFRIWKSHVVVLKVRGKSSVTRVQIEYEPYMDKEQCGGK